MKAVLLLKQKLTDADGDILELVVWKVPMGVKHPKGVRYRLAFIPQGQDDPALLYDNHHPKGPHKHNNEAESAYVFVDRSVGNITAIIVPSSGESPPSARRKFAKNRLIPL